MILGFEGPVHGFLPSNEHGPASYWPPLRNVKKQRHQYNVTENEIGSLEHHALKAASEHADHFLLERPSNSNNWTASWAGPRSGSPRYDAELFGHWWHEGPEFLNFLARKVINEQKDLSLITLAESLAAMIPAGWSSQRQRLERGKLLAWTGVIGGELTARVGIGPWIFELVYPGWER